MLKMIDFFLPSYLDLVYEQNIQKGVVVFLFAFFGGIFGFCGAFQQALPVQLCWRKGRGSRAKKRKESEFHGDNRDSGVE